MISARRSSRELGGADRQRPLAGAGHRRSHGRRHRGLSEGVRTARDGGDAPAPHGLLPMAQLLDEHAQAFRSESQAGHDSAFARRSRADDDRLRGTQRRGLDRADGAASRSWGRCRPSSTPPSTSSTTACTAGTFGEGLGMTTGLSGDVGDFLAPIMFILWQATTVPDRVGGEPLRAAIRVSGRNGGTWNVNRQRQRLRLRAHATATARTCRSSSSSIPAVWS